MYCFRDIFLAFSMYFCIFPTQSYFSSYIKYVLFSQFAQFMHQLEFRLFAILIWLKVAYFTDTDWT